MKILATAEIRPKKKKKKTQRKKLQTITKDINSTNFSENVV